MSTTIQEQDLIQEIKQLQQRVNDLERKQTSLTINAINNGSVAVYKKITSSLTEELGMSYNSINYNRIGTPPDTQNVDINFNANGFALDYFNASSSALGWFRLSDQLDLRLDAHDVNIPTSSSSTGTKGTIKWNSTHLYVCTATNTWRRVALSTF
jgi:hypothetical protein